MNQLIQRLTSLGNLSRWETERGQIATVLILSTVVLLIFAMVMLNLGNVASTSTTLSNAADSAALLLASQLGTKSRLIYQSLGNSTKKCQKRGFLSMILAIVVAVVVIIFTAGAGAFAVGAFLPTLLGSQTLAMMAVGAAAGAVGGAIGGGIAGTGVGQGALMGAAIGAAIGGAAAGLGAAGPATSSVGSEVALSAEMSSVMGSATVTPVAFAGAGEVALGALGLAGAGYNQATNYQMTAEIADEFSKQMNKLSESDRIRESTMMQALQQVVDDPNRSQDTTDVDLDSDTSEYLSDFQIWSFTRIKRIIDGMALSDASPAVLKFLNEDVYAFELAAANALFSREGWRYIDIGFGHIPVHTDIPGSLERQDYQWTATDSGDAVAVAGRDGSIADVLRAFALSGRPVSFWKPGPNPAQMNEWMNSCGDGCDVCPDPPVDQGYDRLDDMAESLAEMYDTLNGLRTEQGMATVASAKSWMFFFYDREEPENPASYYQMARLFESQIPGWITEMENIRRSLPACRVVPFAGIINAPCRFSHGGGSIDDNTGDEIGRAISDLQSLQTASANFRAAIEEFYPQIYTDVNDEVYQNICVPAGEANPSGKPCGGKNPVEYQWTDSRGMHIVRVKTVFKVPSTKKKKYGNWVKGKICVELQNGQDSAANPCQVIVARYDESKNMGSLGTWNPFGGWVTKAARGRYTWNWVGLR